MIAIYKYYLESEVLKFKHMYGYQATFMCLKMRN